MQDTQITSDEEIRQIAYRLWQEEGCPIGQEVQHWLRAQTIWEDMHRRQSKPKTAVRKGKKEKQSIVEREL